MLTDGLFEAHRCDHVQQSGAYEGRKGASIVVPWNPIS